MKGEEQGQEQGQEQEQGRRRRRRRGSSTRTRRRGEEWGERQAGAMTLGSGEVRRGMQELRENEDNRIREEGWEV